MAGSRIREIDVPHDIDLLRRLKPHDIDFVLAAGRPRRVRAGSLITYQGEPAEDLLLLLTRIERARGFLDAAKLSEDWIAGMQKRALVLEAHYTTHIEGTQLTLEQSERILAGQKVRGARPDDAQQLLNYKKPFLLTHQILPAVAVTSCDTLL